MNEEVIYWTHKINMHWFMTKLFGRDKVPALDVPSFMEEVEYVD